MNALSDSYLHPGQQAVFDCLASKNRPRIFVLACGARWGKDRLSLVCMLTLARTLAQQEREARRGLIPAVLCWYVAPTMGLLRQMWDEMEHFCSGFNGISYNRADRRVFLPGDVQIEFKSADRPASLLGRGVDMVVCTEAARMKREAWENSILTRLSSPGRGPGGRGGIAILNSTPAGQNFFYELYLQGLNDPTGYIKSWHFTSYDNPYINNFEIDRHKTLMPERAFRQEYLAEFLAGGGSVFRGVENCFRMYDYPVIDPAGPVSIGIDWGRHNDRTAVVAICNEGGHFKLVNHLLLKNLDYESQMRAIEDFCSTYNNPAIVAECNGLGDPLVEQLSRFSRRKIIPFTTTAGSKKSIVEGAAFMIEQKNIVLPATKKAGVLVSAAPELTDELCQYECIERASGIFSYSAPPGLHDDLVMAFCFALNGRQAKSSSGGFFMVK